MKAEEQSSGVKNLLQIQATILGETYDAVLSRYIGKQYGYLKVDTANVAIESLRPIREKTEQFLKDRAHLDQVLKAGAEAANARAKNLLNEVYKRVGLVRE